MMFIHIVPFACHLFLVYL
uniref:Uncharacterized protein n=1 Tax=Rhizophora mucronata TaxID=61149 RepID=A0A2P2ITA2_RHIMU